MGQSQNYGPPRLEALQPPASSLLASAAQAQCPEAHGNGTPSSLFKEGISRELGKSDLLNLLSLPFSFSIMEILFRSIDDLQHVMTVDLQATSLIQRGITYLGRQLAMPLCMTVIGKLKLS
jgi:hypothetical protein